MKDYHKNKSNDSHDSLDDSGLIEEQIQYNIQNNKNICARIDDNENWNNYSEDDENDFNYPIENHSEIPQQSTFPDSKEFKKYNRSNKYSQNYSKKFDYNNRYKNDYYYNKKKDYGKYNSSNYEIQDNYIDEDLFKEVEKIEENNYVTEKNYGDNDNNYKNKKIFQKNDNYTNYYQPHNKYNKRNYNDKFQKKNDYIEEPRESLKNEEFNEKEVVIHPNDYSKNENSNQISKKFNDYKQDDLFTNEKTEGNYYNQKKKNYKNFNNKSNKFSNIKKKKEDYFTKTNSLINDTNTINKSSSNDFNSKYDNVDINKNLELEQNKLKNTNNPTTYVKQELYNNLPIKEITYNFPDKNNFNINPNFNNMKKAQILEKNFPPSNINYTSNPSQMTKYYNNNNFYNNNINYQANTTIITPPIGILQNNFNSFSLSENPQNIYNKMDVSEITKRLNINASEFVPKKKELKKDELNKFDFYRNQFQMSQNKPNVKLV